MLGTAADGEVKADLLNGLEVLQDDRGQPTVNGVVVSGAAFEFEFESKKCYIINVRF